MKNEIVLVGSNETVNLTEILNKLEKGNKLLAVNTTLSVLSGVKINNNKMGNCIKETVNLCAKDYNLDLNSKLVYTYYHDYMLNSNNCTEETLLVGSLLDKLCKANNVITYEERTIIGYNNLKETPSLLDGISDSLLCHVLVASDLKDGLLDKASELISEHLQARFEENNITNILLNPNIEQMQYLKHNNIHLAQLNSKHLKLKLNLDIDGIVDVRSDIDIRRELLVLFKDTFNKIKLPEEMTKQRNLLGFRHNIKTYFYTIFEDNSDIKFNDLDAILCETFKDPKIVFTVCSKLVHKSDAVLLAISKYNVTHQHPIIVNMLKIIKAYTEEVLYMYNTTI